MDILLQQGVDSSATLVMPLGGGETWSVLSISSVSSVHLNHLVGGLPDAWVAPQSKVCPPPPMPAYFEDKLVQALTNFVGTQSSAGLAALVGLVAFCAGICPQIGCLSGCFIGA